SGIINAVVVVNWGTINVGWANNPLGQLAIVGDYEQENSGTLNLTLGGTVVGRYNRLLVQGIASLDGSLGIRTLNYAPTPGDTPAESLIAWGSLDPQNFSFTASTAGWRIVYLPNLLAPTGLSVTRLPPPRMQGRAWNDANGNGLQDAGEAGVANVQVSLFDAY